MENVKNVEDEEKPTKERADGGKRNFPNGESKSK